MGTQQFCLKWNNHHSNMLAVFEQLLSSEALVDVTLACEGLSLKAHKMVLSACSPFFQSLFLENPCQHPIVIMKDMRYTDLKAIMDFMYRGEVNVSQNQLTALLKTAEALKVRGLAEVTGENCHGNSTGVIRREIVQTAIPHQHRTESPPPNRRKRCRSHSLSDHCDGEEHVLSTPDSPEVVTGDVPPDSLEGQPCMSLINHPQIEVSVHRPRLTVASHKSHSFIDPKDLCAPTEKPTSFDDADFNVDMSNLMVQSMTTENEAVFPDGQAPNQKLPMQLPLLSSSTRARPIPMVTSPVGDNQSSLPTSQDSNPDVKPEALVPYEKPPISPVLAGPLFKMNMFLETSGGSSLSGSSNYQPSRGVKPGILVDEVPHVPPVAGPSHEKGSSKHMLMDTLGVGLSANRGPGSYQEDENSRSRLTLQNCDTHPKNTCSVCFKSFSSKRNMTRHMELHFLQRKRYKCHLCHKRFSWETYLQTHMKTHHR